jgi:hypothetical protein
MTEHIPVFLFVSLIALFMIGLGYLITQDENRTLLFKQQCIESGMQYLNGSCIK